MDDPQQEFLKNFDNTTFAIGKSMRSQNYWIIVIEIMDGKEADFTFLFQCSLNMTICKNTST